MVRYYVSKPGAPTAATRLDGVSVPIAVVNKIETLALDSVATTSSSGSTVPTVVNGNKWTANGLPVVFYNGAEYCPYCAAERWPLIIALSRFGTFSGLEYMTSSTTDVFPRTPTFSFLHATYSSKYITFLSVENFNNYLVGSTYLPLQSPTPAERAVLAQFDPGNGIPFVDVGNRYIWSGASYLPGTLSGNTWSSIIASLSSGNNQIASSIYSNADAITTAICKIDGNKPYSVCH